MRTGGLGNYVMTLLGGGRRRGEMNITQGFRGVQQPLEDVLEFAHRPFAADAEISFRVLDRARQGVDVVVQTVEFIARNDQLVLAQLQFACPLARDPVPLTASLAAEQPRAAGSAARRKDPPTPTTMTCAATLHSPSTVSGFQLRHDENGTRRHRSVRSIAQIV
jgi:hypothetical protein